MKKSAHAPNDEHEHLCNTYHSGRSSERGKGLRQRKQKEFCIATEKGGEKTDNGSAASVRQAT